MLIVLIRIMGISIIIYMLHLLMKKDDTSNVSVNSRYFDEERIEMNDKLHATELSNKEKFENIMKCAKNILDLDNDIPAIQDNRFLLNKKYQEHPIFDFIRILGRGMQSDYMKAVLYYDMDSGDHRIPNLEWGTVGFNERSTIVLETGEGIEFYKLLKEVNSNKKISLSKDLILPWPWMRARLINTLKNIGQGRKWGGWNQDDNNHYLTVWLPMGICWVKNGNHSIAVGIIQGGEVRPNEYYDISNVYNYVRCDGENFMRTYTNNIYSNEIIAPVTCVEFAAIFEIGRLLVEQGISFVD